MESAYVPPGISTVQDMTTQILTVWFLRTQLTPIIDNYDFDAVLQGHDHTYSRTYQISTDGKDHTDYTKAPSTSATDDFNAYLNDNICYNLEKQCR